LEKNSSEFLGFQEVRQNLEEKKNSEFLEFREVRQNLEEKKNSLEFFECAQSGAAAFI
jgi:hypothetical protein